MRNALFLFAGKFFFLKNQGVACHLTVQRPQVSTVAYVLGQYISQVFVMKIPMKGNGRRQWLGREDFPLQLYGQIHEGRIFFSFRRACLHEVCRLFQLGECFPEGHQQLMIYRARFSWQFFLYVFPALGVNHVELCQQFIVLM